MKFEPEKISLPESVNSEAWIDWCEYRRERKPLITERSAKLTVDLLSDYDLPVQQEMINNSIRSGYQGVFAPKNFAANSAPAQTEDVVF